MTTHSTNSKGYVGWLLPAHEREMLLKIIPAHYERLIAHHCTLQFGVDSLHPLPTQHQAEVLGVADDAAGVQALVLRIGGSVFRPDHSVYHVTWSLAAGRQAVESNAVIQSHGYTSMWPQTVIDLEPSFFPFAKKA
jgi:hypothetical protein